MIGAFGCAARNSFHTDGYVPGKCGVQHDAERNIQFLEQPANAQVAPGDRVLAERLVHEVRVAGRQVRAQDRPLAEAEHLDEQSEADRDLFAAGPGGDMNRVARKFGTQSVPSCARATPEVN